MNEDKEKIKEKENEKCRGLFICFEGIEASGKSAQIKMVEKYFKDLNQSFHSLCFPCERTKTKIVENTKGLKSLKSRATHLLVSFNRWEKREEILSKLESGENVIIENYAFDCVANLIANGEKMENSLYCDKGLPRPDIVFHLDVDPELTQKRKELNTSLDFLIKKREAYKEFKDKVYWKVISAKSDACEVFKTVTYELNSLFKEFKEYHKVDELRKNFYPKTVGEDLFLESYI